MGILRFQLDKAFTEASRLHYGLSRIAVLQKKLQKSYFRRLYDFGNFLSQNRRRNEVAIRVSWLLSSNPNLSSGNKFTPHNLDKYSRSTAVFLKITLF